MEPIKGMVQLRGGHPVPPEDLLHSLRYERESVWFGVIFSFMRRIRLGGQAVCACASLRSIAIVSRRWSMIGAHRTTIDRKAFLPNAVERDRTKLETHRANQLRS